MENELVYLKGNEAFIDSLIIAKGVDIQHKSIVRTIKAKSGRLKKFGELRFVDFKSLNPKGGRPTKVYQLNEEQATLLITFLDNSEIVDDFKEKLIREFYRMRCFIAEKQTQIWIETRQRGKLTRKAETDMIKKLVEYAKEQGSSHPDMLYMVYSKLANNMVGIKERDNATVMQLNTLGIYENICLYEIEKGMENGLNYKQIYQKCKIHCEEAKGIALLQAV
ncbi:MAG: Rha family transcriptional regulator [Lachnospiraceae bacterium]|nr:Rha family transcriptional regulator [Lachnospiraceae bacterium]